MAISASPAASFSFAGLACGAAGLSLAVPSAVESADPLSEHAGPPANVSMAALRRLIASVVHDVRTSVSAIVYSVDYLEMQPGAGPRAEMVRTIGEATRRLQLTADGLLDYAALGPAIAVPVSLPELIARAERTTRALHGEVSRDRVRLDGPSSWVRGNPVILEQLFASLLFAGSCGASALGELTEDVRHHPNDPMVRTWLRIDEQRDEEQRPISMSAWRKEKLELRWAIAQAELLTLRQAGQLTVQRSEGAWWFVLGLPRSEGPR